MNHFYWKNRRLCITRIVVMMNCIEGMTIDRAIAEAIVKTDEGGYRYCGLPQKMSPAVREKLKRDVEEVLRLPHERLVTV